VVTDSGGDSAQDVVSPELVLVSSPEEASRARARLPERPWIRPAPQLGTPSTAVIHPPPHLRLVVPDEPAPPRTHRLRAFVLPVLLGGALVAAGYLTEHRWLGRKKPQSTVVAILPSAPAGSTGRIVPSAPAPASGEFVPARTWSWAPAAADAYEVTFYRNGQIVLHRRLKDHRLVLPPAFRFRPGTYRWTVEALPSTPGAPLIADSSFSLSPEAAAAANRQ